MSGEYVGILDPHRKYIGLTRDDGTIESGQLLKLSEFCKHASHSSLFEDMFGFSSKPGEEFKGTIFRFPFRKQDVKSHLSNTVYSADKVISDLYQPFQMEAERILLFLKHVSAIELYTWNTKESRQEKYLNVTISPSSCSEVNLRRKHAESFCKCSQEESSSAVTDLYTCKVEVTGPTENESSGVQVYNWLICNTIGTSKSSLKQMAKDLMVAPWVGVAVQVPTEFVLATGCTLDWNDFSVSPGKTGIDIVKAYDVLQRKLSVVGDATSHSIVYEGYAFCFLPLPTPTGLPVNVHGYFSVADNRRSIKWPAPDVKGNDAKWNDELVHSLLIPSYAILLAARTKMFSFNTLGDSPYSWWPDPHCVEYSPTWRSIIPDLSSLLLQLPIFWTGADGGKWVSQDGAIFLPPTCPPSVAKLLLQLGFAVVHIPNHVLQCFGKTAIKFASTVDVCQYLKHKSTEAKTMMLSEITVVQEFLEYFVNSCIDFSHLIGLPIILLDDWGMSPAFLQEKNQGDPLYVMLDKSNAAMLPGLEDRIVSFDVPNNIAKLYTRLAETEKFQLQIVSDMVVASSLLHMSMGTWCNPDTDVRWTPGKKGHPSRDWLVKVWEWLAKHEVSNSSTEFVLLDLAKVLPIVPMESLHYTGLAETILLPLSDALTGVILQMPPDPDEDTVSIFCVCQKLGIKIVQYSSALNKLAHQIVPTLNALALLHALMIYRQSCNMSVVVKALENEEREKLKKYLEPSVDAKQMDKATSATVQARVAFLKSIPFHTVKDENGIHHSTLSAQVIFVAPDVNLPESIPLFQPLLYYTASELGFYKVLLDRDPELLTTLVQNHILPNLHAEEDNTEVFLWILQNLCDSDGYLITTLKETAFLPSQDGKLHYPYELFDPEDKQLRNFFSARHPAFPHDDFTSHDVVVKLRWLGIQTWPTICSTEQSFIAFVLAQAKCLANVSREEGLKRSEHLVREIASSEFCQEAFAALADVPFLFCEMCPPSDNISSLSWFGELHGEKVHKPTEIYASAGSNLSLVIGSVCPILSKEYRNVPDLVNMCCQEAPSHVVAQLRNVACLPKHVLQEEESRVTPLIHQVYSYLNTNASSVIELDIPSSIWHPQQAVFVPLTKVALYPIDTLYMIPYRFDVSQLNDMGQYMKLWKVLGMRETLDVTDCEEVLLEIQEATKDVSLATDEMKVVHSILQYLKSKSCPKGALLPTKRNGLMNPVQCVFDDCEWLVKYPELDLRYSVVLAEMERELAQYFGAVPLSQKIANPTPLEIAIPEHETKPVKALVRERLNLYQCEVDPFLEMIQLADCASATSVKFIFDWRRYGKQSLFSEQMAELQGPALFVIINIVLTEDIVKQLCSIGSIHPNKSEESVLHPSDGCDFCSVYPLSDLPMLWNGTKLLVFDPLQAYVCHLTSKPSHGVQFSTAENMDELQAYYSDQLKPFVEVSSYYTSDVCSLHSSHALFRLPFRRASKEYTYTFTPHTAEQVVSTFSCIGNSLPVFLQNIREVEFCEIGAHSDESQIVSLLSVVKATTPAPPVAQSLQSGLECCEVRTTVENEDSLSKWLAVSQHSNERLHVDVAISVVQENGSMFITSPSNGQKFFSRTILNHTLSPWQNCLVNVCLIAANGKRLKVWPTTGSDVLTEAASDLVSSALLRVLTIAQECLSLSGVNLREQNLDCYYKLWPTDSKRVYQLLSKADSADVPIVYSVGGTWECPRSCVMMNEEFRQLPFLSLCSCFQEIMMYTGCKIAKLPEHIAKFSMSCIEVMNLKTFFEEVFFGNIHTLPVQERHKVLFFILEHYQLLHSMKINLDEKFKRNRCIPTEPYGHLNVPQALIDRSSLTIGRLYSDEDGRFVNLSTSEKAKATLKELGMKSDKLTDEDVIERARSVSTLTSHVAAKERSRLLLNYISFHQCNNSLWDSLSEIAFLPAACQQGSSHIFGRRDSLQLHCSKDLYLPQYQKLVFTQCPVLDQSIDPRCHKGLQFKGEPATAVVLDHLVALVECVSAGQESMTQGDWKTIDSSVQAVYEHLNVKAQENAELLKTLFEATFQGRGMIWDSTERCFQKQDTVALKLPIGLSSLHPFRKTGAELECLRQNSCLWKILEVKEQFEVHDCVQVLAEMESMCSEQPLAEHHIKMVVDILCFMQNYQWNEGALIPTAKGSLCSPDKAVFDDRKWSEKNENLQLRFTFAHSKVPGEVAKYFGVHPVSSKIASPQQLKLKFKVKQSGQRESLTRRLRGIVEDYKDNIDVFKELIQNADDARATKVKFLLDWRQHPRENLFTDELAQWQGPALYAYNDSVFSDKDFANICELGGATKRCNPLKIGRFGLGFCATYHLTDVPSFVSRNQLTIFDPHKQYISDVMVGDSPGLCVDILEGRSDLQDFLSGHVAAYEDLFGCSLIGLGEEGFQGTLFRFPFRTQELAERSEISNTVIDPSNIEQLTTMLYGAADTLLVFLRNVASIELYELPPNSHPSDMKQLLSVTKKRLNPPVDLIQRYVTHESQSDGEAACIQESFEMHEATSRFSIVRQGNDIDKEETHWLVASALDGEGNSGSLYTKANERIPFAQVAVHVVEQNSLWVPCPVNGYLYCFLPLPISTDLKVLVNGYFEVSKDRRSLTDVQDRSQTDTWNTKLIGGAVRIAFLGMLSQLIKLNESSCDATFVEAFYNLWPTNFDQDIVTQLMVPHFFRCLFRGQHTVVPTMGQEWVSIASVYVLEDLFNEKLPSSIRSSAVELLLKCGYKLADIPRSIQETVRHVGQSVVLVSFKEYITDCLFSVMGTLDEEIRDKQVLFILKQMKQFDDRSRWLTDLMCVSKCVSCEPESRLVSPSDLIDPNSPLACLYSSEEERFPTSKYCEEAVSTSLRELGMKYHKLSDDQVIERASSACTLVGEERKQRISDVLNYLFGTHLMVSQGQVSLLNALSRVEFLPAATDCSILHLQWSGDAAALYCSQDLYLPQYQELVFTQCPVLDQSIDPRCHKGLQFKGKPSIEVVVAHLITLVDSSRQVCLTSDEWKIIDSSVCVVYQYLNAPPMDACTDSSIEASLQTVTNKGLFVWDSSCKCFLDKRKVALKLPTGLPTLVPYRKCIDQLESSKDYQHLWHLLEIKGEFDEGDCVDVLMEMKAKGQVPEEDIVTAISILHFLASKKWTSKVLVPTINNEFMNPADVVYDDRKWSEKKETLKTRFSLVHKKIPKDLAEVFEVPPLSSLIASPQNLKIKINLTGQHESLTRRLQGIIEDYRDSIDVLKELLKNADDAGATEVKFLLDWRQHPRENLFTDELSQWQGPALYAYNDSVFSDVDFANICELGGATKRCDPTKIGQFGLGFCSVYNVTDVPSFVSRDRLVMFDPSMLYLKGLNQHGNPGMSINFVENGEDLAEFYRGHVETFQGIFGCDLLSKESFSGTLFRFPLRTKSTACRSKILNREFDAFEMKESFQRSVEYNLMFLQHVTMVELYEMPKKSSPKGINKHLLVSVTKITQEKLLGNPVQHVLPTSTPSHSIPVTSARDEASPVQDDPTQYQFKTEQFSIRVYCKESVERTSTWLVSSAVGGKQVKQLDECATGLQKGTLLPMAEVAVRLKEDRQGAVIPHPVQGIVFCFLPLPISVSQTFLINGCFTVSKDRRHLSELEDSPHATYSWNRLLIQEPLTQAVLNVLHSLTTKCYSHVTPASLQEYYSLWPLVTPTDHPLSKELKQSFKKAVHDSDYPLLWSLKNGGMWIPVSEATVLDSAFSDTVFHTVHSEIMCVLVMLQYNMVDISVTLYQGLTQGATSVRKVSVLEYYTKVLLPNLHKITDRTVRDSQILFLVKHFQTLKNIAEGNGSDLSNALKSTCCIPCEPNGKLSLVEDLLLPTDTFKILFKEDEDRFPCPKFLDNPRTRHTLTMLGMHTDTLKEDDVVERAEIVITLPEEEANLYCSTLFSYIAKHHGTSTELLDRLFGIVFLPLHIPDSSLTLPWYEHAKQSRFACQKDVYHPSELPLVFTFAPVADEKLVGPCLDIFKLKHAPSGVDVWNHTKRLVTWAASCPKEISEEEAQYLNVCMSKIYHHLEMEISTFPDFFDLVQRECDDLAFLWQDRRFHKPSQMVHSFVQGDSCYPYLVKVNEELSEFKYLLQASRVESMVTLQRVEILLRRIFDDHGSTAVGAKLVCFARALVSAVYSQQRQGQDGVFYLPDTDEVMQPSTELVNKEFDESSDINAELVSIMPDSTLYLHTSIPKLEAKRFGVQDVLSTILGQMIDPEFAEEKFKQHEPLEVRINNILAQYRADESIFSEFIQNADDACATEIAFVLDHRCDFGTQSLAVSGNTQKWETLQKLPSLLIYNNRKFSENDIKGISKLGLGSKQEDANKIGQFGLGFNAAYHVTDCPMFLSHDSGGERENFCVFDPLCTYLPHDRRKPRHGLRYKLKGKEKAAAKFTDQFEPFILDPMMQVSLTGCFKDMHSTTVWPNGYVVFRLPLTRQKQRSRLRNAEKMTEDKLKELLDTLKMQASNMLLFLNHLRRITMVEISQDGCIGDWWSIGATSNIQPFASDLNQTIHILKNSDQGIPKTFWHFCDAEMKICCASNSEEQTMKWMACHRFGGSDISQEMIRDSFERQHVLPVVAVAAPVASKVNGQLFRSLPVSECTTLPVHIHGQFTVDPSRKFLEGSDWNSALTEIVARAYADLLVYCRQKVSLSKETQAWYYSLFPSSADFSMDVLMPIVPRVYQQLLQVNAEVLLAANIDKTTGCLLWHALSYDDEAQNKGWFPATDCPLASHVLISIGMNIVEAPTTLQETVESLESHYNGAVTPRLVRICLQKMTRSDFDKHKGIVLEHIKPLLSYVLQDINEENVAEVEGLPLMLSGTGEFKLIQKDQPLFTLCFVDLIPRRSKCRENFVSPVIREDSRLYLKLQNLQLLTGITAEAIAENVELPRHKVVPVSECNHALLLLLWEFILNYNSERRQYMLQTIFGSLAIIPTSLNTVVPVNMAHTVLKDRGSVPLLSQLELPVVNFSKLSTAIRTTTSTGHQMDEAAIQAIAVATVSPLLCDPSEPLPVLAALEAHEPPVRFQPKSRTDVLGFISFILKCPCLKQYATTLRKLKMFELALKEHTWVSIGKDDVMYAVNCSDFPRRSLQPLQKERILIYRLYENCEMFFKALGILVPTPVEFYQGTIFPAFASNTFSAEVKINHLEFILAEENMWKDLQADLKRCQFIDCNGKFCSPSQLFDPKVKLLTTFLSKTAFPQPPWSDEPALSTLRKLGLQQEVSDEEVKRFAERVQDFSDKAVKKKSSVLLKHLNSLIKEGNKENKLDKVRKLLSMIADVAFIPRFFPPDMATSLTDIGVAQLGIETSGFVCLRGSVMCDAEHASLASLCKPVILAEQLFHKSVDTATKAKLCDSARVAPLSTDVVLQNLLRLVHSIEVCQIMSSTKCRSALHSLQDTFKMHYEFLSKNEVAAVRSLKGVPCIFVPSSSGESFQIIQGNKLVERVSHESSPYCHLLCVVPDYLNDASMREFRQQVGIQRSLTASHYLSLLRDIHTDMQEQVNSRYDPNLYVAADAAYRDLVLLLCGTEDASRQAEMEVASVIEGGDQVYLPSRSGKLLPSKELILCDDDWIQDKLTTGSEEQIHFEFVATPPPVAAHSLPSCLKVRKLSDLVTEEIDSTLLKDEYNLCTKEVYAKQHDQKHGCTSVITLLEFIQTPEFAFGIQRIMHHKLAGGPLVEECKRALEMILRMDCVCVQKIRTCFKCNGKLIQGAANQDMTCFLVTEDSGELKDDSNASGPAPVLYVRFHDNVDDLLAEVVMQLNKVLGPFISDTQHLQVILKCITEPGKIQGALDHLHIKKYTSTSSVPVMLSSQLEVEGNELIIACNFRANERVMYCDADGHVKLCTVEFVTVADTSGSHALPAHLCVRPADGQGGISSDTAADPITSLLVCKFLSPGQMQQLKALLNGQLADQSPSNTMPGDKLVLLEVPQTDSKQLQRYLAKVMSLLSRVTSDQIYFVIERLLFHLHFLSQVREESIDFDNVVEVFVNQVLKKLKGVRGDHTQFIHSLEKKISVLKGEVPEEEDVRLSPPLPIHMDQATKCHMPLPSPSGAQGKRTQLSHRSQYSRLSSWSTYVNSTPRVHRSSAGASHRLVASQSTTLPQRSGISGSSAHGVFPGSGWRSQVSPGTHASYSTKQPINIWQPSRATFYTPVVEKQPETSVVDAQMWLTQACHDLKLAHQLVDLVHSPSAAEHEQGASARVPSVCEYPEAVCFYSHEIVEKALKAVFLAYCGLKHELAASNNVVDIFEKLTKSAGCPEEVKSISESVYLVSRHGRCCRFPDDNLPPAAPVLSHSTATAKETLSAALRFLEAVSKLQLFREYFPDGTMEISIQKLAKETGIYSYNK